MRENPGDFRKSIKILKFLSPLPHVPLPFTKRTCWTMILKRMQLTNLEWNIEHQTLYGSNFSHMGAPFTWILKKKYNCWWKKDWQGRLKLRYLTEIGRFHWNQGEKVAHYAWSQYHRWVLRLSQWFIRGKRFTVCTEITIILGTVRDTWRPLTIQTIWC